MTNFAKFRTENLFMPAFSFYPANKRLICDSRLTGIQSTFLNFEIVEMSNSFFASGPHKFLEQHWWALQSIKNLAEKDNQFLL